MFKILLIAASFAFFAGDVCVASQTPTETAETSSDQGLALLAEAHDLVSALPLTQRLWMGLEVAEAMNMVQPKVGGRWSLELWPLSQQLPPLTRDRVPLQKNIVRSIATSDPDTALRLAMQIQIPPHFEQMYLEDPRSVGSTVVLDAWRNCGLRCLDQIDQVARFNAAKGEYPYVTMGDIAVSVAKTDLPRAHQILSEAVHFYQRDPGFTDTNELYTQLILNTQHIASPGILKSELGTAVAGMERSSQFLTRETWKLRVVTPSGDANFDTQKEELLYRLLPLIKLETPELVAPLLAKYASLRIAPPIAVDTPVKVLGGVLRGDAPRQESSQELIEGGLVYEVRETAGTNPAKAFSIAETISNPHLQTVALVILAPAYHKIDPEKADQWLEQGSAKLNGMPGGEDKLDLAVNLLTSELELNRPEFAEQTMLKAFDIAEAVYDRSQQQHPEYAESAGHGDMVELAFIAGKTPGLRSTALTRIQNTQRPGLKATFLISAAEGIEYANGNLKF